MTWLEGTNQCSEASGLTPLWRQRMVPRLPRFAFIVGIALFQLQTLVARDKLLSRVLAVEDVINQRSNYSHVSHQRTIEPSAGTTKHGIQNITLPLSESFSEHTIPSYEVDDLCGGCRYTTGPKRAGSCGKKISRAAYRFNISIERAAHSVLAGDKLKTCQSCIQCESHHKVYWRPDRAAPTIRKAFTHYLDDIPNQHRIPREVLATHGYKYLTEYFEEKANQYPSKTYLFEFNPSIVPFTTNDRQQALTINGQRPTYVASYRVGNQHSCVPPNVSLQMIGGSWDKKPEPINHLAIALLDSDLSVLASDVFNLPKSFRYREDFRLHILHGMIYLSSLGKITPLFIGTRESHPYSDDGETKPIQHQFSSSQHSLLLTMGKKHIFCSSDSETATTSKNLNYFVDSQNQTMVEIYPAGQFGLQLHEVQPVNLSMPTKDNPDQQYGKEDVITDGNTPARTSFYTMDELEASRTLDFWENPYTADRGSACCIEFDKPQQKQLISLEQRLLLGISHVVIPDGRERIIQAGLTPNQYLSRFYAIEPSAPYRTVAQSGYICFSQYYDTNNESNPLAKRKLWQKFTIGDLTLECPAVHFVSGLAEKVGDPSTIIIAYGVNDCTSWFVEVDKQEVIDLLFGPPKLKQ